MCGHKMVQCHKCLLLPCCEPSQSHLMFLECSCIRQRLQSHNQYETGWCHLWYQNKNPILNINDKQAYRNSQKRWEFIHQYLPKCWSSATSFFLKGQQQKSSLPTSLMLKAHSTNSKKWGKNSPSSFKKIQKAKKSHIIIKI